MNTPSPISPKDLRRPENARLRQIIDHNKKSLDSIRKLILVLFAVMFTFLAYAVWQSYQGRVDLINVQRASCERGKLDRKANAAAWTAHTAYISSVVLAQSVKEDVKTAARKAVKVESRTARELTHRSHINCEDAFPSATLLP